MHILDTVAVPRAPYSPQAPVSPFSDMDVLLPSDASTDVACFYELSTELADCIQMVMQTLLQVSPAQILDPAKE